MPHTLQSLWVVYMVQEQGLRDDEGRLLREARAPAEYIRANEIEYKPCPYSGSRKLSPAMPMNVSALRATSAHWDDIVNAVALMRAGYERLRPTQAMQLWDVWRVTQLGSALPWYFILAHRELAPAYAANLAKATLGMGIWGQRVFARTISEAWTPPPLTAQVIHELAEGNQTYLAEHEVCAGPEKMLLRFYDAMLDLAPDASSPQMTRLARELPAVLTFGAHYVNMKLVLYVMFLARRFLYADLAQVVADPALAELLAADCQPPDFTTIGPADLAGTPPAQRAAFLATIAQHLAPMAPDGSDLPLLRAVIDIAAAMTTTQPSAELLAEVGDAQIAQPIATWLAIDAVHARALAVVEAGMRGAVGAAAFAGVIGAAERDRHIGPEPRGILSRLAPRAVSAAG